MREGAVTVMKGGPEGPKDQMRRAGLEEVRGRAVGEG